MATPYKTTLKRYDGAEWVPVYLSTSADIVQMGETFNVKGQNIGAFSDGDAVNSTDSVLNVVKKILQKKIPATYTKPTISLTRVSGSTAGQYEPGTTINIVVKSVYTQKDGGAIVTDGHFITDGTDQFQKGNSDTITHTYEKVLGDSAISLESQVTYEDGPIKNNNFDEPSPDGQIKAGTLKSSKLTFTPARYIFWGADSAGTTSAIADSAGIRALSGKKFGGKNTTFDLAVPKGSTRATIAFPKTVGTLAKVEYVESGNANVTGQFALSEVQVEGANAASPVAYNVYTLSWVQPTAGPMTLHVTI